MKKYIYAIIPVLAFTIMQGLMGILIMVPTALKNVDKIAEASGDTAAIMKIIPMESMAWAVLLSGIATVVIISVIKLVNWKSVLNIFNVNWAKAVCYIAAAAIGIFALDLLEEMMDLPNIIEAELTGMASTGIGFVTIGILGPICEELIFREGTLGYMLRNNVHPWRAVIISAVIFGMVHGNPAQVPFAAAMGIILGYIYYKTGNIVVPALIHIINNSFACWTMVAFSDMAEEPKLVDMLGGTVPAVGCAVAGLALCIGIFVWAEKNFGHYGKVRLTTKDGEWVKQTWDFDGNKKEETL